MSVLKESAIEAAEIAEGVPERYRDECFKIVMAAFVGTPGGNSSAVVDPAGNAGDIERMAAEPEVRANDVWPKFIGRHGLDESTVSRVLDIEDKAVPIVALIKANTNAKMQRKLALIMGIRGMFLIGTPSFTHSELVAICKEFACYDSSNFSSTMKSGGMERWSVREGDNFRLTNIGQKAAVDLISELAAGT